MVKKYITPYLGTAAVVVVVLILINKVGSKIPVIGPLLSGSGSTPASS